MKDDYTPYITEEHKRVQADQEEAIMFLAKIIPKEDKERIRRNIENDPDFVGKQHMFLGMKVRNALRNSGFFYNPHMMDGIWFPWLKEAVCLPEDKIILTDSIKRRIEKFKEYQLRVNPPVSPELDMEQITYIKERLENLYGIRMPFIKVKHSEDIKGSFVLVPPTFNLDELEYVKRDRDRKLISRGIKEQEIGQIDSSTYTIFLRTRQPKQQIGLYASAWHELAHVAAYTIGIKDTILGESFAFANEFRGLLEAAKEGLFLKDKVADTIQFHIKHAKYEQLDVAVFSSLRRMGLKVPTDLTTAYHYEALDAIKKYNPDLRYHGRNLDELLAELDNSIEHILNAWKRRKWESIRPIIYCSVLIVAPFILLILLASLWK